MILKNFKLKW